MADNNSPTIGQRIMAFVNRFREPAPPTYTPPAPGLPPREVFMPSRAPFKGDGPFLFTDMKNGKTTFYPGPPEKGLPMTIDTLTQAVSSSEKGAADPYQTRNIVGQMHGRRSDAYGTDGAYIKTGDPRGRDIHGGGTALTKSKQQYDPQQPLKPTKGCTRGHNEDVARMGNRIEEFKKDNPGVTIPYARQ